MRIRYGMVGGGPDAFIGAVHRMAARLDDRLELVAGAFASTPERSRRAGAELGLDPARVYDSWETMAETEASLPPGERIGLVSIVTPNHLHHPVARAFLEAGFHVVCDKPLATTLPHAEELCRLSAAHDRVFCVTHNYTGYPMVKEARERVRGGALGEIRRVEAAYAQGWLATRLEAEGQKQAEWRTDPARAGASSVLGDIGSHAHDLVRYVTGLDVEELLADIGTAVEGRKADDDVAVLLRLSGGVRGLLAATQVATGERNGLRLAVYGSEGGLTWLQERADELRLTAPDGSVRTLYDGAGDLSERARAHLRLPSGHPEGFIEAFANLYRNVAATVAHRQAAAAGAPAGTDGAMEDAGLATSDAPAGRFDDDFPTVADGARGVAFIAAAVRSSRERAWVDAAYEPPC